MLRALRFQPLDLASSFKFLSLHFFIYFFTVPSCLVSRSTLTQFSTPAVRVHALAGGPPSVAIPSKHVARFPATGPFNRCVLCVLCVCEHEASVSASHWRESRLELCCENRLKMGLSEEGEDSVLHRFEELCLDLNMDTNAKEEALQNYHRIQTNFSLEVGCVCFLYFVWTQPCWKLNSPFRLNFR